MNAPGRYENVRLKPGEAKVTVVADQRIPGASTFYFAKEDHTLGNALRMSLLRDPEVRFAGYRMTHPLEYVCELKVQVTPDSEGPEGPEGAADNRPLAAVIRSLDLVSEEFANIEAQFVAQFTRN